MPNLRKLKLGFNAHAVDRHSTTIPVGIEHLSGLKEISAKIGGASAEEPDGRSAESALSDAFRMHPGRPNVNIQCVDRMFGGKGDESSGTQEEEHMALQKQCEIIEQDEVQGPEPLLPVFLGCYKRGAETAFPFMSPETSQSQVTLSAVGWGISVAGWIVSPIVTRVLNEGFSHIGFPASARRKLKNLEATIPQLQLMLQSAEESSHKERFKQLMTALKDAFYEAEDIVDAIHYDSLEEQIRSRRSRWKWKRNKTSLPSSSHHTTQDDSVMLDRVPRAISRRELRDSLDKIEKIINKAYKILPPQPSSSSDDKSVDPSTSAPPMKVFGRDKDCEKIITMLHETVGDNQPNTNNGLCYSVIGVYGIPGSGKTTLAQYVCDSARKGSHFDLFMWIHVTQNFSVDGIFREMFEAASAKPCPTYSNLDTLERKVEAELRGKRFFLVLDDIWCDEGVSEHKLDQLLRPLRAGKSGSKILVTTRSENTARHMGALNPMPISDLDEEDFFRLFMHSATNGANFHDQDQETFNMIGRDIAKKLKKSPLSAKLVAAQLRRQPNLNFWRIVRERDLLTENMGPQRWSYQHLDEQVRRCFAYCSIFPRRHPLERDELVNLWIAEGLVKTTNTGEQMENIGQGYFDALVSCSFLQPTGRVDYRGTVHFTIHDLLHDLARRVAGSDCFTLDDDIEKVPPDVRHLFIDFCDTMKITEKICRLKKLRTLIFGDCARGITDEDLAVMLKNLRKLRVLKVRLKGIDIMVPASVGHLKHLRCLSIEALSVGTDNIKLPCTFDRLYHLQILELRQLFCNLICSSVKNMSNLNSLRYIRTHYSSLEFPGIGELRSLRTLDHFRVREEHGYELQQLKMLKYLSGMMTISGLENVKSKEEALEARLACKEYLSGLSLEWNTQGPICPPDLQADVLEGLCPPPQIARLEIRGYSSQRYSSWFSGNHNNLKNLQHLVLWHCDKLEALPEIPKILKNLQIITCPSLVFTCMEDVEKIRSMFVEPVSQVEPLLSSTNPNEIGEQFERFKAVLFDPFCNACTLPSWCMTNFHVMLEKIMPFICGYCSEEDYARLLLPSSVERLQIASCIVTNTVLQNCLRGCTSLARLELSAILCLTAIPSEAMEFLTRLKELSITYCVNLTLLHGLNHLSDLETLTITKCPNLEALQDSEKVRVLRALTIDDVSFVPELLSTEGCSSLLKLTIEDSEEWKETDFLQQLTSLNSLKFYDCKWDTLPENLVHLTMLDKLVISDCQKIRSLPTLPESLGSFQLGYCDPHFMDSCQTRGDPNWERIAQVPYKVFDDEVYYEG